jgi:hypothetical protein
MIYTSLATRSVAALFLSVAPTELHATPPAVTL